MITIDSNEDRADIGEGLFFTFLLKSTSRFSEPAVVNANRYDWVGDMLADVAHFCARHNINPREIFERGLTSYEQDNDPTEIGGYRPVKPRATESAA